MLLKVKPAGTAPTALKVRLAPVSGSLAVTLPVTTEPSSVAASVLATATGASLVPVTVIVRVWAAESAVPSLALKLSTTSCVAPAARLLYAGSVGLKL